MCPKRGYNRSMAKMLIKAVSLPLVFLIVSISVTHRLVHDDTALFSIKADLTDSQCATPCIMGIQPGITKAEDAVRILHRSDWVLFVENTPIRSDGDRSVIVWSWSGIQPSWISSYSAGALRVRDGMVSQIELETQLTFSDVWQMFDRPDRGVVWPRSAVASTPQFIHFAYYDDFNLWVRMETGCPMTPGQFWGARVRLILGGSPGVQLEPYDLPRWFLDQPECAE